jgi:hypothetical protein
MVVVDGLGDPINPTCSVPRWIKQERLQIPTSPILQQYQCHMRGVDVIELCEECSTQLNFNEMVA